MRNNEFMKSMTVSSLQGNGLVLELSHKAVKEAQSMKVITILALVYAPASFVAVSRRFEAPPVCSPSLLKEIQLKSILTGIPEHGLRFRYTRRWFGGINDERAVGIHYYSDSTGDCDNGNIFGIRSSQQKGCSTR